MGEPRAWPPALAGTPAAAVIDRAIERGRLGHSLLLHGDDVAILGEMAAAIADRVLDAPSGAHPDCFSLRPAGKMRLIGAEATRGLIAKLQVSAAVAERKVAILYEVDRMNPAAANIFLKTLEEPPRNTTLLLLTAHPYALLATIRSRCLHFRVPASAGAAEPRAAGWEGWLGDYRGWLERLAAPAADKRAVAGHVFAIYGLLARFGQVLEQATAAAWEKEKAALPAELDEDEQVAIETGLANGLRNRLFADIEEATRTHARARLESGETATRRIFPAAIEELEHGARLLRLNLNESAALENFLLASLRLWSRH